MSEKVIKIITAKKYSADFMTFIKNKLTDPEFEEERRKMWEIVPVEDSDSEEHEEKLAQGLIFTLKQEYDVEKEKIKR